MNPWHALARSTAVAHIAMSAACHAAPPPATSPPGPPPTTAHAVNAIVLVNGCARLGKENARLAETAMNQLVDGCGSFAGAPVRFSAQLLPDGSIQFVPGAGESESIPMCVLQHPLKHRVKLAAACTLDVRLEQGTLEVPKGTDGGA